MHKYGLSRAFASIAQPFGIDRRECVKAAGDNLKNQWIIYPLVALVD